MMGQKFILAFFLSMLAATSAQAQFSFCASSTSGADSALDGTRLFIDRRYTGTSVELDASGSGSQRSYQMQISLTQGMMLPGNRGPSCPISTLNLSAADCKATPSSRWERLPANAGNPGSCACPTYMKILIDNAVVQLPSPQTPSLRLQIFEDTMSNADLLALQHFPRCGSSNAQSIFAVSGGQLSRTHCSAGSGSGGNDYEAIYARFLDLDQPGSFRHLRAEYLQMQNIVNQGASIVADWVLYVPYQALVNTNASYRLVSLATGASCLWTGRVVGITFVP